jgi:hypothetical protein
VPLAKRLEAERFHWTKLIKGSVLMSTTQLAALVEEMIGCASAAHPRAADERGLILRNSNPAAK